MIQKNLDIEFEPDPENGRTLNKNTMNWAVESIISCTEHSIPEYIKKSSLPTKRSNGLTNSSRGEIGTQEESQKL